MAKKTKRLEDQAEPTPDPLTIAQLEAPVTPRLESYIRQHDETPRALATVRLEGGGSGDGTYLVDAPVPRTIGHCAARYAISRVEGAVTVYLWVNP